MLQDEWGQEDPYRHVDAQGEPAGADVLDDLDLLKLAHMLLMPL